MSSGEGTGELDALLAQAVGALSGPALAAAMLPALAAIAEDARARVPVRTGETRDHIQARIEAGTNAATGIVEVADSAQGQQAHKAIFTEYGTSKEVAEPFMRPAFEANKEAAASAIVQAIIQGIAK
ncbi:HK97-gp10 family putative phage morphogenesis protein [Brachymonas sp.]|uniref:HK97-gp10 family putative phage morphogenesis protein n=1 Tax=Brachymonas sp. TaxID=1936292 RepID=UPI0035B06852